MKARHVIERLGRGYPAGAVDFRVVASRGAECSLARTEGLSADRVRIGEPDVHCGLSDAGRLDPAGADRARQEASGEIPYATTGVGRLTHLTGELLQHQAGIKLLLVPYTGGPAHAFSDVASGRVALIIEGYSGIAGAARSGSVKLIAVASTKRLAEFPDVPTVAETIPGFRATGWGVLVAPVGTPEAIVGKLSEDLRKVVVDPELEKKIARLGSYTNPMLPTETTAFIHKQQQTWQPVLDEIARKQR
jgi:tripartite-type tricarboxylate transporter receptor subunit TctC